MIVRLDGFKKQELCTACKKHLKYKDTNRYKQTKNKTMEQSVILTLTKRKLEATLVSK